MDIALALEGSGDAFPDIMKRHGIVDADLARYNKDPLFHARVRSLREDVRDNGMTFRLKARAQAEELLVTSWGLIHSPDVSAAVKADLIKSTVKWGGLEPRNDSNTEGPAGGVTIHINLPDSPSNIRTIEHEQP